MSKKTVLGQFYTKENSWLLQHIYEFILQSQATVIYDPFAGNGHLLKALSFLPVLTFVGLDIDPSNGWTLNDSLQQIPPLKDAIIITNPPYISSYSAARKHLLSPMNQYFEASEYNDLYLIALDKMLEAQDDVVAIVPESFINSNYKGKNRLRMITILEINPFHDTDVPVCVVCFDKHNKSFEDIKVFKNEQYLFPLATLENHRLVPTQKIDISFNVVDGWLALRAVDSTNPLFQIRFDHKECIDYDWQKGIKISSRLFSLIEVSVPIHRQDEFIDALNQRLQDLRCITFDTILSPFKGNMKNGVRRRRLDYKTARALIEEVHNTLFHHGVQ
ncbi:MAG: hypothetical protein Q8M70_07130 [bacterium]|nr:hypothetical protein [bacterium]